MKHPHLMHTLEFGERIFTKGYGVWLDSGEDMGALDFFADVGTASLGYGGPEHQAVFNHMINESIPVHAPNLYRFKDRDLAAKGLCEITGMDRVFFCNSGTEAVEAAIKLARLYHHPGTSSIIAAHAGGFHGRTYGALAAGDGPSYHTDGFGPLPGDFVKFKHIDQIPPKAAAVILAPVYGNNDVVLYPPGWLEELREWCTAHGTLLIFDEVQTGSARCGLRFTYAQRVGVEPDIITLAKGLGMGAPVGACLARGIVSDVFTPGSHFSTFGGNPLSCCFINGMLGWATPDAMERVDQVGHHIREGLAALPFARNTRGVGMLNAFDIDVDTIAFAQACEAQGLLIGAFRRGPGTVKITPPLNITFEQAQSGIAMMAQAYKEIGP